MSLGKNGAWRLGEIAPSSDGPRHRPAITSPITRGWPILVATAPNRRAMISTIAIERNTAATSLLKSARCLVAVNFSPAGDRPDGVVSAGFATGVFEATGVAAWSGITVTFWSWRSLALAVSRAVPPLTHLTSPTTPAVLLE